MKQPGRCKHLRRLALSIAATFGAMTISAAASAQSTIVDASTASGMSAAVPVAIVGVSAATALSAATVLTVTSVELSAQGIEIVVEGVIDGVLKTASFTVDAAAGFAVGAGAVLGAATVAGGILLHDGAKAVALIPNEAGSRLLHHEPITRR